MLHFAKVSSSNNNSSFRIINHSTTTWLTLLTREWGLSGQPRHSRMRVAWHKAGRSTLWSVLLGRLGEAWNQPGDCRGSVSSPMMVGRRAFRRT